MLAMPWPRFLVMLEATNRDVASSSSELDQALGIHKLYQEHRARRSAVSQN